jgi:hypothetical protein
MKTATYKGRVYRLEYVGATKFGRRAKLAFLDGSKEFWVDAAAVREGGGSSYTPSARRGGGRVRTCSQCGGNEINQTECGACA